MWPGILGKRGGSSALVWRKTFFDIFSVFDHQIHFWGGVALIFWQGGGGAKFSFFGGPTRGGVPGMGGGSSVNF